MTLVFAVHKVTRQCARNLIGSLHHIVLFHQGRHIGTTTLKCSSQTHWPWCRGMSRVREMKHSICSRRVSSNYDKSEVVRDVLLYKNTNSFTYRLIGVFACAQLVFWGYLTHTAFTSMKDAHVIAATKYGPNGPPLEMKSWKDLSGIFQALSSTKWRYGVTILCIGAGASILGASVMFSRRSVSSVVLRKGGENVTFVLFGFFGVRSSFTVPISRVSCQHSRTAVTSQLPVKVKGHMFHYILDKQGKFYNGRLFDYTVGMKRVFV